MSTNSRRHLISQAGIAALGAGAAASAFGRQSPAPSAVPPLPAYARLQDYTCERQSSFDRTGGNADRFVVPAGATQELLVADHPGIITHIWFTVASPSEHHLKELVLRMYWDGHDKPSVEVPVGDFFGLNLGQYFLYQSAFLNCSSAKAMNAYFAMPFRRSARITVTNEGAKTVDAFYSNIDYQRVASVPEDSLYFHAHYRQATPNVAQTFAPGQPEINLDGAHNYVFVDTPGRGHLLGVTLGVIQDAERWFGEGDDMTFIDGNPTAAINGTGTEDYFCGAWDFGGRDTAIPFAHLYTGAPFIALGERTNGRYCLYRWHADNPITFRQRLRHTIEHGHANDRRDSFYSVAYWYQTEPAQVLPPLPPAADRNAELKL